MRDVMMADMATLGIKDSQVLLICLIAAAAILVVIIRDYVRQVTADALADAEAAVEEADMLAFDAAGDDTAVEIADQHRIRQAAVQSMSAGQQFGRRRAA